MDRRDFIRLAIASTVAPASSRAFGAAAYGGKLTPPPVQILADAGLRQLREWMDSGRYSCASIVEGYLARIDNLDSAGPTLRSVLETNRKARLLGASRDSERRSGLADSPLHGIPLMLKDNVDTAGALSAGMLTTAGSLALMNSMPSRPSTVAQRLEAVGALILGKTNLSEWANFRSERSSSGWSGRGGQTRNPHVLNRNPCGSSSGSAAAVAAGLCAGAIGTETNGSIVCPAGTCGIVGLKPTVGLVSRAGIVPISASQDTAGPMTIDVTGAAVMLGGIAGVDPRDPATSVATEHLHADYTQFLDRDGLRGARIGVMRRWSGRHEGVDAVYERALDSLRAAGAELIDPVDIDNWSDYGEASYQVLKSEFKDGLNRYLATRIGEGPKSLAEVIAFNDAHADTELEWFGQDIMIAAEATAGLQDPAYLEALATVRRMSRDEGIDAALGEHHLDAIVAPTNGPAWTTDRVNGDNWVGISSSSAAARAGYPNITVPAGHVHGLPIGISLFAGAWSEPLLLRLAYAFEQQHGGRVLPTYRATLP
ncbi:MAG: amidase [Pseudomonadota bacterium]